MLRMPASKQIFLSNKQGWPCPAAWAGWVGQHHQINVEQKCGERGQGLFIKCVELMITGPSLIRYQKLKIEVNNYYSFAHCECFVVAKSCKIDGSSMHSPSVRAVSCVPIKRWWLHHYRILGPSWDWRGQYFTRGTLSPAQLSQTPDTGHGSQGQGASRGHLLGWLQFRYNTLNSW